jgi:predicted phosphoadenosine phosphosulfate sulfurtransferase
MKNYLETNVFEATKERINYVFDNFDDYFVSFSGGKDSGVMLNMVIEVARERGRLPVPVLFYDWECIYKETHGFVSRMMHLPEVEPTWVCLPVTERNGSSNFQPFWRPWHKKDKELWVRDMPDFSFVVNEDNMPEAWKAFYDPADHDQRFFISYADWFAKSRGAKKVANFIGIRVQESHDRYKMLKTQKNRIKFEGRDWCYRYKQNVQEVWYTMPCYDFLTEDVWTANGKMCYDYNHIYDTMYQMGVSIADQRVCNPYGEQQRRGLHQYHECEPETWFKVVNRVAGANFGAFYNKTKIMSGTIPKPTGITWEEYLNIVLFSLPDHTKFHYERNFDTAVKWHQKQEEKLGRKLIWDSTEDIQTILAEGIRINDLLTYQLMVETVVKGDYFCKKLFFTYTGREKDRQNELIENYKTD